MPAAARPRRDKRHRDAARRGLHPVGRRRSSSQFTIVESISRPNPTWLPWIVALRKGTTPIALTSLAGVMVLYGINVVMQREWSNQFEALDTLQHQQSALVTQVERKKYQIPRELEVDPKNYVDLNQENTLFIEPEANRPIKSTEKARKSLLRDDRVPIGY